MTTDSSRLRPIDAAYLVGALGLIAGFVHVAILLVAAVALHRLVQHGFHLLWMAPTSLALLTSLVGLIVWSAGRWLPRLRTLGGFVAGVAWVPATALVYDVSGLTQWGGLALGVGLGVVAGRLAAAAPRRVPAAARLLAWTGLAAVAIGAALLTVGGPFTERIRRRWLRDPAPGSPNILLVVLDTVRAMSLGVYGYRTGSTPFLDQLASRGLRFEHAFSTAPWTTPSHSSMMTGKLPTELDVGWHHGLGRKYPTVAEALGRAGYSTAGFTANLINTSRSSGVGRGFQHYEDYPPSFWNWVRSNEVTRRFVESRLFSDLTGRAQPLERKYGSDVNRAFFHWLDRQPRRPWFVFLNYFDGHAPYESDPRDAARFGVPAKPVPIYDVQLDRDGWDRAEVDRQHRSYDAALATLDRYVKALYAGLEERGLLGRTVIIVTSDHGEEFFEHEAMRHGNTLYRPALEVPLIFVGPGFPPDSVATPVSTRSIARTLASLVPGVDSAAFEGRNLARATSDGFGPTPLISAVDAVPGQPERLPVHWGPLLSIFDGEYHYIVDRRGVERLFAAADRLEVTDLVSVPAEAGVLARFRTLAAQASHGNQQAR